MLYGQDIVGLSGNTAINLLIAMNTANLLERVLRALISDACKSTEQPLPDKGAGLITRGLGPLSTLALLTIFSTLLVFL